MAAPRCRPGVRNEHQVKRFVQAIAAALMLLEGPHKADWFSLASELHLRPKNEAGPQGYGHCRMPCCAQNAPGASPDRWYLTIVSDQGREGGAVLQHEGEGQWMVEVLWPGSWLLQAGVSRVDVAEPQLGAP